MYRDRFLSLRHTWRCHDGDLVRAFRKLQDAGRLEVITSTATHAFFPLLDRNWAAIRAQVHIAADQYEKHFGCRPPGMWLGECGYVPGVDELLREAAIRYFFVDTHGLLFADPPPGLRRRTRPIYCRTGVAAFARDVESSRAGVEREGGLPRRSALPRLLPRHRLRPADGLHRPVHPPRGAPHLHRDQVPRDHPRQAARQVGLRPRHRARRARASTPRTSAENRQKQVEHLAARAWTARRSSISPYDAELYGHWWYEGPLFLNDLFRQLHSDQDAVETITPGEYLRAPPHQPGGDAVRLVLGARGLQRVLAQRDERLDLPPPARRGRAHGRAGAPLPGRAGPDRRAPSTRPRAS